MLWAFTHPGKHLLAPVELFLTVGKGCKQPLDLLVQLGCTLLFRLERVPGRFTFSDELLTAPLRFLALGAQHRNIVGELVQFRFAGHELDLAVAGREAGIVVHLLQLLQLQRPFLQGALRLRQLFRQIVQFFLALPEFRVLGLQVGKRLVLVLRLERQSLQGLAAAADLDQLLGRLLLEALDVHLEPARGHGELGADPVLFSHDLGRRHRHRGLEAPARQGDGPPPDGGRYQRHEKDGAEEAECEEQDRLDQGGLPDMRGGKPPMPDCATLAWRKSSAAARAGRGTIRLIRAVVAILPGQNGFQVARSVSFR